MKTISFVLIVVLIVSAPLFAADDVFSRFEDAIDNDDLNAIQLLIDSGADVDARDEILDWTPLMYAARFSANPDIIKTLIESGSDVNVCDEYGWTPLMYALTGTNPDIVKIMIEAGADVNVTFEDWDGKYSVLTESLHPKLLDMDISYDKAKALIIAGADVNFIDPDGMTPFGYALKNDVGQELIDLMIEYGASAEYLNEELLDKLAGDVFSNRLDYDSLDYLAYIRYPLDMRDDEGMSLLMHSVMYPFPDVGIVSKLLEMGANPNARTLEGVTPLMLAATYCPDTEIIEILINAGADVNARTEELTTPLMVSVANKNEEVVDFLIKAGADINAQDENGDTALYYAAHEAVNPAVIDILLEAGADATIVNERGRKAFESANEYSDTYRTPAFWRLVDASF